ncbi:MAG: amino acid-binding protein, partial [Spirochaetales bacterium]|nr:amino acid-binding protein [Spirochaetales bacterium]
MQESFAVVRAIGRDRIGIVGDLSTVIERAGCNIEESKMAVLGGEFAVMILVSGESSKIAALSDTDFNSGVVSDLQIDIIPTQETLPLLRGVPYQIETVSLDSPGIVHALTALLASEQINIEELETDSVPAPFTG